ncbi:MAG: spermidine/putrescine transport system ATP-binding protein [Pseudomonadota bacterium]|nr:spermidine/putrescine transport system ATP-binding protein [Pseudomonadota bacterium]
MAILEIKNITKQFDDNLVVDNISINIEQGEFFTLLGPSGCGKTTLLRMLAGFITPDSGSILLDGKDITHLPPEKRPLHTIFQSYALFPHLTVFDNIAFPLKMAHWDKHKITAQVEELLEDVRLTKFMWRYPHELSGGQKQRVAIARSLVDRPKLLLLDEPLSALDARLREHMHIELVKLQEETGVTFVYVTHDQQEALALSSRIAVMNLGSIEQLDKPAVVYSKPKTYFVADFLGKCNLLKAEVLAITDTGVKLKVADSIEFEIVDVDNGNYAVGQIGWYSIRPEKIKLSRKMPTTEFMYIDKVVVNGYYYYGDATLYELSFDGQVKLQVMLSNTKAEEPNFFIDNSEVFLSFDPEAGNFIAEDQCSN